MTLIPIVAWLEAAALVWMLSLVVRRPRDVRLRWITAMVACWSGNLPCILQAVKGEAFLGLDPMWWQFIGQVLVLTGAYCMVCFFAFTLLDERRAAVRAKRQALVLVTVLIVLLVATVIMPADMRLIGARLSSYQDPAARGVASIALFYTAANAFMLYAEVTAAVSTGRAVRHAAGWFRRALLITTAGSATLVVVCVIFVLNGALLFANINLPTAIQLTAVVLLLPGCGLFFLGITLPAAVTRVAAARIWLRHRRAYRDLAPLWTLLHAEFPEDALTNRVPTDPRLDRFRLTGVHRRFYRRVIECRDGLVRISPYVAHLRGDDQRGAETPAELAQQLRRALHARAAGIDVEGPAVPIASPATDGFDADVSELLTLASALPPVGASAR
ncbi:MAB_1171c family putative transporter [Nocardia altamirensis]|uniref:MAB_1171c family putative transporter n=1 Tax=Nocardia altamirensis TaxID=472158 RepID=UPI0009FD9723|nr:MAB_1171c family putative transporter [Nocardia altamirensis]